MYYADSWTERLNSIKYTQSSIFQSSCPRNIIFSLLAIKPCLKYWSPSSYAVSFCLAGSVRNAGSSIAFSVNNAGQSPKDGACLINCVCGHETAKGWPFRVFLKLTAWLKDWTPYLRHNSDNVIWNSCYWTTAYIISFIIGDFTMWWHGSFVWGVLTAGCQQRTWNGNTSFSSSHSITYRSTKSTLSSRFPHKSSGKGLPSLSCNRHAEDVLELYISNWRNVWNPVLGWDGSDPNWLGIDSLMKKLTGPAAVDDRSDPQEW